VITSIQYDMGQDGTWSANPPSFKSEYASNVKNRLNAPPMNPIAPLEAETYQIMGFARSSRTLGSLCRIEVAASCSSLSAGFVEGMA
jgi:hypothetical protein